MELLLKQLLGCSVAGTNSVSLGANFPLFPLCMLGGMLVDKGVRCCRMALLVDHNCMQRVSGIALDYLITAALATMDLQAAFGWPFAFMCFLALNVVGIVVSAQLSTMHSSVVTAYNGWNGANFFYTKYYAIGS